MRRLAVWAMCVACAVAISGCARRPPVAIADRHQGDIASRDVPRGAVVFNHVCAACHAGRVNPRGYRWSPAQMRRQVREGNRLMPPIPASRVSEEDLEAVLAYLSTIQAVDGVLPAPPWEPDDGLDEEAPEPDEADAREPEDDTRADTSAAPAHGLGRRLGVPRMAPARAPGVSARGASSGARRPFAPPPGRSGRAWPRVETRAPR